MRERPRGYLGAAVAGGSTKKDILDYLPAFLTGAAAKSGQTVNYDTALKVTTVLACCVVRANGLAQVPWRVMRALPGGGAAPAPEHPLYSLFNRRPNDDQTSFEYRETIAIHLALARNHYSFISRGLGRKILELIPLEPNLVEEIRERGRTVGYWVTGDDGRRVRVDKDEIWHIRGLSWNGWKGMDAVKLAAEAIGLSLALEESHALLHANGIQTSGTYAVDGKLTEDQHKKLTAWIKKHAAGYHRFEPLILDNGAKWLSQQMTGVDAEHVATRQLQVIEICRMMNVQPMMIFALDKPTYTSAEQLQIAHVVHTMMPEYERIEQSADVHLLEVKDDTGFYTHFDEKKLQRGSLKDRGDFLSKLAGGAGGARPLMTQDEARDDLDLPRMGGAASQLLEPMGAAAAPPAADNSSPDDTEDPQ